VLKIGVGFKMFLTTLDKEEDIIFKKVFILREMAEKENKQIETE